MYAVKTMMREKNLEEVKNSQNAEEKRIFYSMHTMTLRARLTYYDMKNICEKLIDYSESHKKGYYEDEIMKNSKIKYKKFTVAERFGFNTLELLHAKIMDRNTYWLDIKINPRRMFHKNDYPFTYIANENDIKLSCERIQVFLDEVGITEIGKDAFYIHRIDYCVNIDLQNRYMVDTYMRLIKKGRYPYHAQRMLEYSKTGKRFVPTKNSFTVYSDICEFSVYDKSSQLQGETEKYSEEEIRQAEGMIRIEYRAKRAKVRTEEKKNSCMESLELLNYTPKIAEKNISRYVKLAYGSGRFVKYEEAKSMIEESGLHGKTKNALIDILKMVSRYDLQTAQMYYEKDFGKYMKQFNKLGISPITIERSARIEEFPNPLYYIEYRNKNYVDDEIG